jgi:hypothetical protein
VFRERLGKTNYRQKVSAFFGKGGVELDPTKMPEELVGNWEIEGKQGDEKFVFSINPLSGYARAPSWLFRLLLTKSSMLPISI